MSKEILEGIEGLGKTILEQKAASDRTISEVKASFESQLKDARKELADLQVKHEAEVKQLNEDLQKKGATLAEIQEKVLKMEKKGGKIRGDIENQEKKAAVLIAEAFEESY